MDTPSDNGTFRDSGSTQPSAGILGDRAGEQIGKFKVLGKLGEGGMGVVYVAYDGELDRRVAVKLLRPELSVRPRVREQLLNEAQMLAKMSHPNVLQVYDVGIHRQQIYLALEYIEGESLRAWQERCMGDWHAVVALYRACGEGLVAAHANGLVHRDFKPENVLVGLDGRPRVLDFGLATFSSAPANLRSGELVTSSQERGRRVGTPAYMSPEQHAGMETDARSDQFNYCASLYEALYGARPFRGGSLQEIGQNLLHGAPVPARGSSPVWLRRLVLRGLALDPAARWPSMQALLDEIDRRMHKTTGLWTLYMSLMALFAGALIAFRSGEEACTSGTRQVMNLWSIERLQRIEEAFTASGVDDVDEIWRSVRADVEGQMVEWHGVYNAACLAHVRSEVSDAVFYAQVACLDQRMLALETVLSTLEKAGPDLVRRARRGLGELQPVAPCGRRDQLRMVAPLPSNPSVASEVATLQGLLTRDEALRSMEVKPARPRDFPRILERAQATGHTPLVAQVLSSLALEATPNALESERLLLRAVFLAEAAGDDILVAQIGIFLVHVMGNRNLRFEEAGRWADLVQSKLERTRTVGHWRAELEHNRGTIARRRGDEEGAREHFKAALHLSENEAPRDIYRMGVNLRYLAAIDVNLGNLDRAESTLAGAAAMMRASVGQEHRRYGLIRLTQGHIQIGRSQYGAAKRSFSRLVDFWAATAGPSSSEVALALQNLAEACIFLGEHGEALGHLDRGETILRDSKGDASPAKAGMLMLRGAIERDREAPETAEILVKQALQIYTARYQSDHPDLVRALLLLGEISLARGDLEAAERYRERAESSIVKLPGAQRPLQADLALLSAELAICGDDQKDALDWARAASLQYEGRPAEPWKRGRALFALSLAEAAAGAPFGRVYYLASAARAEIQSINANQVAFRKKITRWLAALSSPGATPAGARAAPSRWCTARAMN